MKKSILFTFLLYVIVGMQPISATNPISKLVETSNFEVLNDKNRKTNLFTNVRTWIQKKVIAALSKKKIRNLGLSSLIIGILSILLWGATGASTLVIGLIVILALIGDILAIATLLYSRKEKKENRKARRMAWWGLVLSLLTVIVPFFLLILLALSFM